MKFLKAGAFVALLFAGYLQASAQKDAPPVNEPNYRKPKIFADLPEKMPARIADMESLLDLSVGATVNTAIAAGFPLVGTVIGKSVPVDRSSQSVVIRSQSRQGATFTFTRIKNADGTFSYIGRMIEKGAGDALEIVREGTGYVIRKKGYYDMISE